MERTLTKEDFQLKDLEEEPLDVLDLPQIYTEPSAKVLLDTLSILSLEPRSWDTTRTPSRATSRVASGTSTPLGVRRRKVRADGVPQYLTRIVSSNLGWIEDDAEKEQIWDSAAVRLSERSGRTAMGAFTRAFPVVVTPPDRLHEAGDAGPRDDREAEDVVDVQIHEPGLTADNVGHKTWAASYVLAKMWKELYDEIPALKDCRDTEHHPTPLLELGAGTGLVGIAAAIMLGARVLFTDLPEIVSNLARNIDLNAEAIGHRAGSAATAILDWSKPGDVKYLGQDAETRAESEHSLEARVIVAADPVYSSEHPALLVNAISYHLSRTTDSAVILGLPLREPYAAEREQLRESLRAIGLHLILERNEVGIDDWTQGNSDEPSEVECNISAWTWSEATGSSANA